MSRRSPAEGLLAAVPGLRVAHDADVLETYRFDQARLTEAGIPAVVAFPRAAEDVEAIVRWASDNDVPVVPRGAGSGLSGGANAIDGCIVLSMASMDRILQVDVAQRSVTVQPGAITADIKRAVAAHGLHYPPDPASYEFCTIGGNIATNAGGLCCVKYGVTGDFVLGLEVVLGDGTRMRSGRRSRKGVAGYDLTRLFVGSEGTLGVVTEATLRLLPAPAPSQTFVAEFPTLDAAGDAIETIMAAIVPSMLELMDRTTLQAVERWKGLGIDHSTEAMLIARSDAVDAARELGVIEAACVSAGAVGVVASSTAAEADMLLEARRLAFPALERLGSVLLDDVAVPPDRIADLLAAVASIAADTGLLIGTFGHAGDGNLHPTIVFDQSSADALARVRAGFAAIVEAAIGLGGTVTGEHGVGVLKRGFLPAEIGARALDVHAAIKAALDPRGILNPGKAF